MLFAWRRSLGVILEKSEMTVNQMMNLYCPNSRERFSLFERDLAIEVTQTPLPSFSLKPSHLSATLVCADNTDALQNDLARLGIKPKSVSSISRGFGKSPFCAANAGPVPELQPPPHAVIISSIFTVSYHPPSYFQRTSLLPTPDLTTLSLCVSDQTNFYASPLLLVQMFAGEEVRPLAYLT